MHLHADLLEATRGQRASHPLELEFQMIMRHLTQVLGSELESSGRVASSLKLLSHLSSPSRLTLESTGYILIISNTF